MERGNSEPRLWFDDVTSAFRFRRRAFPPRIDFRTHPTSVPAIFSVFPTRNSIPTGNVNRTIFFFRAFTSARTLLPLEVNLVLFLPLKLFLRVMLFLHKLFFSFIIFYFFIYIYLFIYLFI